MLRKHLNGTLSFFIYSKSLPSSLPQRPTSKPLCVMLQNWRTGDANATISSRGAIITRRFPYDLEAAFFLLPSRKDLKPSPRRGQPIIMNAVVDDRLLQSGRACIRERPAANVRKARRSYRKISPDIREGELLSKQLGCGK